MFEKVTFSNQQTYSGVKKVFVEAVPEGRAWGSRVLEICRYPGETGLEAWVLCLPEKTIYREPYGRLPARHLTGKKTLQECKAIARRIVLAAGSAERLEELRTATEAPEWAKPEPKA